MLGVGPAYDSLASSSSVSPSKKVKIKTTNGKVKWYPQVGSNDKEQPSPGSLFILMELGLLPLSPEMLSCPVAQAREAHHKHLVWKASLPPQAGDSLYPTFRVIRQPGLWKLLLAPQKKAAEITGSFCHQIKQDQNSIAKTLKIVTEPQSTKGV